MKTLRIPLQMMTLVVVAWFCSSAAAQAAARLLPFQGRLTDSNGVAIVDGSRVVQFKIYNAPVGGVAVWNGEVQKLTVNGGLVSTILGTKASLGGVDFNQDLYLELTVDANADNQITLSDPPLLPRQSILPAVFAYESANARALDGYDWSPLFGTNNPADGTLLSSKIADSSLNTAKISDGAITAPKIATGAVTRPKLDTTGAVQGDSLTFNGTQVVWGKVNSVNADTLDGFDWSHLFSNANPSSGMLNVANMYSRGALDVAGSTTLFGNTTIHANLTVRTMSDHWMVDRAIYLRNYGDFNHFIAYGNTLGTQTGFDGPWLAGVGGGVLGTSGNWTLRWTATGNVQVRGSLSQGSDRNIKENFEAVDAGQVLSKVLDLPIARWNYKDDPAAPHIGPVSQDFRAAFGLGTDDKTIATVDADGVALAAIQGLNQKVEQEATELRAALKAQQELIGTLKAEIEALKRRE